MPSRRPALVRNALATCLLLASLAFASPARAQFADGVLWYNTSNLAFTVGEMEITLQGLGAPSVEITDVWPGSLATYRLVFLVLPDADFTVTQVTEVEDFLADGGLLVTVADNDNYDDEADRLNALLAQLGLSSFHDDGMYDVTCPREATAVGSNPLVDGVGIVNIAASSDLVVAGSGEALLTGQSGQNVAAYEGGVVLCSDTAVFSDWCLNEAGNYTLWENMFAGWCDMDGDGHDKAICGGGDCDDTDPALNPGQTEILDGLDNDCDGLADEGILPAGALIVTEIMKDPDAVSDTYGEWFEVYNASATDLNLLGLDVTDGGTDAFEVLTDLWIGTGDHIVFGRNADSGINGGVTVDYEYSSFQLVNSGTDEVILTHGGLELDRVEYDDVSWPNTAGASASLHPDAYDVSDNDDPDNWCDASTTFGDGDLGSPGTLNQVCCTDADGDGFIDTTCGGPDCDDTDAAVHPGAAELECDGVDNDCDSGTEDEPDGDGDGASSCTDCDDGDAAVHPGASEVTCDGVDNDCDGGTEDEPDGDGDGYSVCDDCDDTDAAVHPGAVEVTCDGVDNDCDAGTDDEPDGDGDGSSACVDCDDADATTYPGGAELHDGADNDCDGLTDEGALPADALVITEVMRDPDAVTDDEGEWFEVVNNTAVDMDLAGLWVYDLGTDEFTVEGELLVPAGRYAVLGRDADPSINGDVVVDYEYAGFSLANTDDEIVLEHGGVELDRIEFGTGWPEESGHAMSLGPTAIDPTDNDDPANWCDAPDPWGVGDFGSPGEENPDCCSDDDGDGYGDAACGGEDCDDGDVDVHPDAEEVCDEIDNDCDGGVDEDLDCDPADDDTGDDDTAGDDDTVSDDDTAGDDDTAVDDDTTGDDDAVDDDSAGDDGPGDCSCRAGGGSPGSWVALTLLLVGLALVQRRR